MRTLLPAAIVALAATLTLTARAADTAAPTPAETRYANEVREARARAQELRTWAELVTAEAPALRDVARDDAAAGPTAVLAVAAAWDSTAAAYARGAVNEGDALRLAARKFDDPTAAWQRRLEARRRQATVAPTQRWFTDAVRYLPKGAVDQFCDLAEARKSAAEAWGRVAEATVPGAARQALVDLREAAANADVEVEIATWVYTWATTREPIVSDTTVFSEDLKAGLEAIKKIEAERITIRRDQARLERRARDLDEDHRRLEEKLKLDYDTARRARDDRRR